jgi:hypothetical protein
MAGVHLVVVVVFEQFEIMFSRMYMYTVVTISDGTRRTQLRYFELIPTTMSGSHARLREQATELVKLLNGPLASSILRLHPNDVIQSPLNEISSLADVNLPAEWSSWWNWERETTEEKLWIKLARNLQDSDAAPVAGADVPSELLKLLQDVQRLSLPRDECEFHQTSICAYTTCPYSIRICSLLG